MSKKNQKANFFPGGKGYVEQNLYSNVLITSNLDRSKACATQNSKIFNWNNFFYKKIY